MTASFDLEQLEVDLFRGRCRQPSLPRAFGGEVAGQALGAAGRTVPGDRPVHSLHAYFVRPGDPERPIVHRVDAVRDGGSFTTRRVTALQDGEAILTLSASFQEPGDGPAHQARRSSAAAPDELPTAADALADAGPRIRARYAGLAARIPLELRFDGPPPGPFHRPDPAATPRRGFWMRSEPLPDDGLLQACVLTYASDLLLLSSAVVPHGIDLDDAGLQHASLDHAVWFHAPARADQWLYCEQVSSWAGGGRALCHGTIFDRAGALVATVAQEGLLRHRRS